MVGISKLKFTGLQREILEFLFRNPLTSFNGRELAKKLKVSPTAISKAIKFLVKTNFIILEKNIRLSIKLNRENEKVLQLKRVYNLESVYTSGIVDYLSDNYPGTVIILFGSYSFGEDIENSDIDIAVIGTWDKGLIFDAFESKLQRNINIQFFIDFKAVPKNLLESFANGIVLKGAMKL